MKVNITQISIAWNDFPWSYFRRIFKSPAFYIISADRNDCESSCLRHYCTETTNSFDLLSSTLEKRKVMLFPSTQFLAQQFFHSILESSTVWSTFPAASLSVEFCSSHRWLGEDSVTLNKLKRKSEMSRGWIII